MRAGSRFCAVELRESICENGSGYVCFQRAALFRSILLLLGAAGYGIEDSEFDTVPRVIKGWWRGRLSAHLW